MDKPKREPKVIKRPIDEFETEPEKPKKVLVKKDDSLPKAAPKPKAEPKAAPKPKAEKVEKPKKEPRPIIIKQIIKKEKKAPTAYNLHIAKEVKAGKSFKEATASWQLSKTK